MGYGTIPFPIASGFDDHKDAGVYFCAGCHAAGQKACSCLAEMLGCFVDVHGGADMNRSLFFFDSYLPSCNSMSAFDVK
jgi:hypothetical protein